MAVQPVGVVISLWWVREEWCDLRRSCKDCRTDSSPRQPAPLPQTAHTPQLATRVSTASTELAEQPTALAACMAV